MTNAVLSFIPYGNPEKKTLLESSPAVAGRTDEKV
jgi:hypothetical protein